MVVKGWIGVDSFFSNPDQAEKGKRLFHPAGRGVGFGRLFDKVELVAKFTE